MFPNASTNATKEINFPSTESRKDPNVTMRALEWHGNKDVRVEIRPKPMVTDDSDAIIQITSTTICGSDLHLYHNEFQGMEKGDVLGHEFMGIVESIGPNVKNLQVGDRVVVSAVIADGTCYYCQNGLFSNCDRTNPSIRMEKIYGHRTAAFFGYSHLTGGYEGGQAEFARVPYADVNCLKVPQGLADEKVLFLSDIACTGWHANVLGGVHKGQTVAIWGAGPVGLMAAMWAKFRGANRVILIDCIDARLKLAEKHLGIETINFTQQDTVKTIQQMVPNGPDVCIEAVGFRYAKGILHKLQRLVKLESDTPEMLQECIFSVRKGGTIAVVGDYYHVTNAFPIGAFMEKGLTMSAGQVHLQQYWKELLGYIEKGEVDPSWVITHTMTLDKAAEAYRLFDEKVDDAIKIVLKP